VVDGISWSFGMREMIIRYREKDKIYTRIKEKHMKFERLHKWNNIKNICFVITCFIIITNEVLAK
jgi:hypothetical protein